MTSRKRGSAPCSPADSLRRRTSRVGRIEVVGAELSSDELSSLVDLAAADPGFPALTQPSTCEAVVSKRRMSRSERKTGRRLGLMIKSKAIESESGLDSELEKPWCSQPGWSPITGRIGSSAVDSAVQWSSDKDKSIAHTLYLL